jgi:starch-binding outer membrane protein, SusD/RagB family
MTKYIITILIALSFTITSCKKFLETKSVQTLATPSSLNDLEAILNNNNINKGTVLLNGMTDEYYYVYADWLSRAELQAQGYIWKSDLNDYVDWVTQYYAAFNANTVLFNLQFIEPDNQTERRNSIKGQALFYRALAHYRVAQLLQTMSAFHYD